MAEEIERKFLVNEKEWREYLRHGTFTNYGITQGYLFDIYNRVGRIRHTSYGSFIFTYKGPTKGITRKEVEFKLPRWLGKILVNSCKTKLIKTRTVTEGGWEVDEFHNLGESLLLAEIELRDEHQSFEKPLWVKEEVSHDKAYFNSNLIKKVI